MKTNLGDILDGKVTGIMNFGAFVKLCNGDSGLVHISEVSDNYVKDINTVLAVGDSVTVKVIKVDENKKLSFSIKKAKPRMNKDDKRNGNYPPAEFEFNSNKQRNMSFEDMMSKFKQSSEEKMCELKKSVDFKKGNNRRGGR